jgi:type IV pilus assembly protein PilM
MAVDKAVWGIEIGQAGLKAIKLRYAAPADQVLALAFDYVPHPKILSQPDAIPEELIRDSLKTFLSRNKIDGDLLSIALPGSTSLARFIQLPPVDASKVQAIIEYEAKQQIPFPLDEVFWDYQTIGSGNTEGGFLIDAEVGLFAMKKDKVFQALAPYTENKLEIQLIQIAPLGVYNFVCFEELGLKSPDAVPGTEEYVLVLDMGADNTTLMLTNGKRIWIRNISLGGGHFTRALTKEMKLPFAKAEHLKINAIKSPDPKAVFQVLKPVFNEYVNEIQKSIGFFSSVNRDAKISHVVGLGNGFKLAGLQKFLEQSLNYPVKKLETFEGVVGNTVLNAPLFKEHALTFAVPYGLALQLLERTSIQTNLLPPEIKLDRIIRTKKPWAVLSAACLLAGVSLSAAGYANVQRSVAETRWGDALSKAGELSSKLSGYESTFTTAESSYKGLRDKGLGLVVGFKDDVWLEFYHTINQCLPRDAGESPDDIQMQNRVVVSSITTDYATDVGTWFTKLTDNMKLYMKKEELAVPPTGPGYVVRITGYHVHHDVKDLNYGTRTGYIVKGILSNLQTWTYKNPGEEEVDVRKMGISHATLIQSVEKTMLIPKREADGSVPRYDIFLNQPGNQLGNQPGNLNPYQSGQDYANPYGQSPTGTYDYPTNENSGENQFNQGDDLLNQGATIQAPVNIPTESIPQTQFVIEFVWKPTDQKVPRPATDPLLPPATTPETPPTT